MRIVAGEFRGRRIAAPPGRDTRPTSDRVREALFAIVGPLDGVAVLDLFAGSGALGLEALSRGARSAVLVDHDRRAVAALRANVAALGVGDRVRVVARDWRAALAAEARAGRRVGLCLLDPPYTVLPRIQGGLGRALAPVMEPGGTVVVEGPAGSEPPALNELDVAERTDRTYGTTRVTVARLAEGE
jgi:16S rRNA (guanine966-N2)-methyltransferase